jgi:hypothetical protein
VCGEVLSVYLTRIGRLNTGGGRIILKWKLKYNKRA